MALYAFDGTGDLWDGAPNTATIQENEIQKNGRYLTNVVFFYKEYLNHNQNAEYFPGVGSGSLFKTHTGKTLDFIFGGAFGIGARGITNRAFERLKVNFANGDNIIDIVGFSRGAAVARMFADKTFKEYKNISDQNKKKLTEPPIIRFVGLFDTVASFGNPFNDNELYFQPVLPPTTENAFHAMSFDLNRKGFGLDRVYGKNVLEVWFKGGHGDIGGNSALPNGSANRHRTNITLKFMLKKAFSLGLVNRSNFDDTYPSDIQSPLAIRDLNNPLDFPSGSPPDVSRLARVNDIFHYSMFDSSGNEIFPNSDKPKLAPRSKLVIEEPENEVEISEQRLLQLTPDLAAKFPDNQLIYELLHRA